MRYTIRQHHNKESILQKADDKGFGSSIYAPSNPFSHWYILYTFLNLKWHICKTYGRGKMKNWPDRADSNRESRESVFDWQMSREPDLEMTWSIQWILRLPVMQWIRITSYLPNEKGIENILGVGLPHNANFGGSKSSFYTTEGFITVHTQSKSVRLTLRLFVYNNRKHTSVTSCNKGFEGLKTFLQG